MSAPKRRAGESDGDQPVKRSEIEAFLDEWKQEIQESFKVSLTEQAASAASSIAGLEGRLTASTAGLLKKYDEGIQAKFQSVDDELEELKITLRAQDEQLADFKKQLAVLTKNVAQAEQVVATPTTRAIGRFDREPDLSVLKISTNELAAKDKVFAALEAWLDEGDDKAHWKREGANMAKNWTLATKKGTAGLAAKRVEGLQRCLKHDDGTWREFHTSNPAGGDIQIYISEDKSPKKIKEEVATRKPYKAFIANLPPTQVFTIKKENVVSVQWIPVAKVSATAPDRPVTVHWHAKAVRDLSIDKEAILKLFEYHMGSTTKVEWSL